jgi:hypothetical protein
MDLQDMKDRWAEYDRKLETSLRLNTRILREINLSRVDSVLKRLSRLIVFELLANIGAAAVLGMFIARHLEEARFLAPAVLLSFSSVALVIASIRQLGALHGLDYSAPVVAIQKQLEALRIERIRTTQWVLLLSPLLWTPLLIVALEGLLGIDSYLFLDGRWLAANLLVGLAFIPLMLWVARRFAGRWQGSPLVRSLMDDLAGRSLVAAAGFLSTLSGFEEESPEVLPASR